MAECLKNGTPGRGWMGGMGGWMDGCDDASGKRESDLIFSVLMLPKCPIGQKDGEATSHGSKKRYLSEEKTPHQLKATPSVGDRLTIFVRCPPT